MKRIKVKNAFQTFFSVHTFLLFINEMIIITDINGVDQRNVCMLIENVAMRNYNKTEIYIHIFQLTSNQARKVNEILECNKTFPFSNYNSHSGECNLKRYLWINN